MLSLFIRYKNYRQSTSQIVDICDEEYYFINSHEIKFLIRKGR